MPKPKARVEKAPVPQAGQPKLPAKKAAPAKAVKPESAPRSPLPAAPRVDRHKVVQAPLAAKPAKTPKPRQKPVRDSFTMPAADFAVIATLKARVLAARRETKKSELLRAGLHALAALDTNALVAALGRLAPIKVGRPKKNH